MKDIAKKRSKDIKEKRIRASKYRRESIKGAFKSREKRKSVSRRAKGTSNVLKAFGVISGPASKSGAGRPRGSYKYMNMPIHVYKKMMRDKKAQYQMYQQEQAMKLKSRGFSPEQLQQLQQQQTIAEMQQPIQEQQYEEQYEETPQEYEQQIPQQVQQQYQQPMPSQRQGYGRVIPRSQQIRPGRSVADDELDFRQWSAEKTISPRTQRVLDTIRRIQNKGKSDNIEQQRRNRERNMVGRSMNLLKAHENMIHTTMDFTGVKDDNPLMAENIWKTNPNNNIMRTNRSNILSGENNLKFF
jgi:hypothetical protein